MIGRSHSFDDTILKDHMAYVALKSAEPVVASARYRRREAGL
jgi:hypothetical protein